MSAGGLDGMYITRGDAVEELAGNQDWYADSIEVFDGDFTDPNDRHKIVDTVICLWAIAVEHCTKVVANHTQQ